MGRHYGGSQCHQSFLVKQAVLTRFWALFRRKMGELAVAEMKLLPRDAWDLGGVHGDQRHHAPTGDGHCGATTTSV